MSGSDRLDHSKIGLIISGVISAISVIVLLGWGLSESAEYQRQADNYTRQYAAYANQHIRHSCISPIAADKNECIAEARNEQRANQRNEQDLVAQRQSALWAYIMGAAAVIGMGLSAIGVLLVWTTFRETRKSAQVAQANLDAYRDAERGHAEFWVEGVTESRESDSMTFSLRAQNHGRTPITLIGVTYEILRTNAHPEHFSNFEKLDRILHPENESCHLYFHAKRFSISDFPYAGGYLEYKCRFGSLHRTYFCVQLRAAQSFGMTTMYSHDAHDQRRQANWPNDY